MRDVRRIRGGTVSSGRQEKEWMGCLLDDLRAFGIKTDQWTIAAQDADEWNKTANKARVFPRRIESRQMELGLHYDMQ